MKTSKTRPIVLTNGLDKSFVEGDCACVPGDVMAMRSPSQLHADTRYVKSPDLSMIKLNNDWRTVYQPAYASCFAVLNEAAQDMLQHFGTPQYLADVLGDDRLENAHLQTALEKLVESQTIIPEGAAVPNPRINGNGDTLTTWIHMTNNCNLSCQYCYINKNAQSMTPEIGKAAIDSVFRSASRQLFKRIKLKYSGGEATLNFDLILTLHDYAKELNGDGQFALDGVVLTNGIGVTNKMIAEMEARQIAVAISLDGIGESHDSQRKFSNGHGSFKQVERTLERLENSEVDTFITVTVSRKNLKGLPELVEYLLQRRLPFSLNFYRDNSYALSAESLQYADEEMIAALKKSFKIIESRLPTYSLLGMLLDRARLDFPHSHACGAGINYLVIDHRGKIAKCHMEIENSITNISIDDPLLVLQNSRKGLQNPVVDERAVCRECDWRYWCGGGCPLLVENAARQSVGVSPNCNIYKTLFPDVIRLEGLRLLHNEDQPMA